MMRLVKRGLMFGNLFEVSSSALVGRYNRALKHLTGKTTELTEFHIDISGFSPEIGDELNDLNYLNPDGLNRQFILLSIEQRSAPLLNAHFSMSRSILRRYIDQNEQQLFALTARDAVVGELLNSVYSLDTPRALLNIRTLEVEADTVESHVEASEELTERIFRFMEEEDAWWDDVLIADMIELSKRTGDIIKNPLALEPQGYTQDNFYTSHFGGMYVFKGMDDPAVIAVGEMSDEDKADLPVEYPCSLKDRYDIAAFLEINDLVEPIGNGRRVHAPSVLKQKLDFIVVDVAANQGENLSRTNRRDLRALRRKFHDKLPPEYHTIEETIRALESSNSPKRLKPHDPAYFYVLRAKRHQDQDLINMLLAQLTPLDFRQLYICHKDAFYDAYRGWSDGKKDYVAKFLEDEYMVDKAGAREALFGPEPSMDDDNADVDIGLGEGVGPWGKRS